jgi:2,3-diketo-5-methylthio-1-phosphopentane phosphatase
VSTPVAPRPGAVLLDIEGTTTPIALVTQVLFPYARQHLRSHLSENAAAPECASMISALQGEHEAARRSGEAVPPWRDDSPSATLDAAVAFAAWLMDRDRKSTALKELQGRIWEEGFRRGELVGELFADVGPALEQWHAADVPVGIFSSGSVLAQQLLFRHSPAGDLTPLLRWHFDTRVGSKTDRESYRRIVASSGVPAEAFVFVSDVVGELDAARAAGMQVRLASRPGNAPVPPDHGYRVIRSLDELVSSE